MDLCSILRCCRPEPRPPLLQAFGVTGCIWAMFFMQKPWSHRLRVGRPEQCLTESVLTCRPAPLLIANLSASKAFYSLNSLQQVPGHPPPWLPSPAASPVGLIQEVCVGNPSSRCLVCRDWWRGAFRASRMPKLLGLAFCLWGWGGFFWRALERRREGASLMRAISRVRSRSHPPTGTGSSGSPGQGLHQPHLALELLPIFTSSRLGLRLGLCGSHFLYRHHSLRCWRMSEQSPESPSSWQRPSACPSHLFHPAIKPEVKYLLNNAIRPVAHYGIYLAVNYGL